MQPVVFSQSCNYKTMKLSELKTGEKAVVVKVSGHGGFRKRIIEMGFVRGKVVESLQNAPLMDPVKYRVMSYEVSLRRSEAMNIEVVSMSEVKEKAQGEDVTGILEEEQLKRIAFEQRKHINVAIVGNPNCGKTTLFNRASGSHEHEGNYSGVTVDAKEGSLKYMGYTIKLVDLPGTYSLTAYSPEELYVRHHLVENVPDIVLNVADASNLERNLFLTTQLIDMNVRMVIALNMYDELRESGSKLDYIMLSKLLGAPIVPTIARKGWGLDRLFHIIVKIYEGADFFDKDGKVSKDMLDEMHELYHKSDIEHGLIEEISEDVDKKRSGHHHHHYKFDHKQKKHHECNHDDCECSDDKHKNRVYKHGKHRHNYKVGEMTRHIHVNHGAFIEKCIDGLREEIKRSRHLQDTYSTRFLAIKLLEKDAETEKIVSSAENADSILKLRNKYSVEIQNNLNEDAESAITNAKYGFISGALAETYKPAKKEAHKRTRHIDFFLLNKYLSYPVFLLFMFIMFQCTFVFGAYPQGWIEKGVEYISGLLSSGMAEGPLKDLLIDGIIGGVGGVIVFLPNILILYFFISIMEDTGYMARAAFIMDKLMHKMGLHGKSFIPMIMGFGCSVPAIMSARTIESRSSRFITILVTPLMSCSARLPVYLLLAGAFFPNHAGLVLFGIYLLGIALAVIFARVFKKFFFKREDLPFVMELPPYRVPTIKSVLIHMWEKGYQYLRKMGTIILLASVIVWFMGYFPRNEAYTANPTPENHKVQQENSYIGQLGHFVEPVLQPLGFDWKIGVSIVSGVAAKEIVVSTLSVLYTGSEDDAGLPSRMKAATYSDGSPVFNMAVALSLMVFVLIYFPCIATIIAIKHETGGWKWALFEVVFTLVLAWITAFLVYRTALLFL